MLPGVISLFQYIYNFHSLMIRSKAAKNYVRIESAQYTDNIR